MDAALDELAVENLALLPNARLEPGKGLTVITGETGTGKTLLLGALRLLRGEAAPRTLIGSAGDTADVQARFVTADGEFVARRRVAESGSRAYLDGSMVPARVLEERAEGILEIVGQHDHFALTERAGVRGLLDGSLDAAGSRALHAYRAAWARVRELRDQRTRLGGDREAMEREREMLRFQVDEITAAGFAADEETELEQAAERLRNAASIIESLRAASASIGDDLFEERLDAASRSLAAAARSDRAIEGLVDRAAEIAALAAELDTDIRRFADDLEHDPTALADVEGRLATLNELRRKYGRDLGTILSYRDEASRRLGELDGLLDRSEELLAALKEAEEHLDAAAEELRGARSAAARRVEVDACRHLAELGFGDPLVRFVIEPAPPASHGGDAVDLEFASDRSLRAGPVASVASGGELSRIVLALRLATGASDAPIIAFDEIDAGVGGQTALAMGRKLSALAEHRQVLCVTHLPQVAAFADTHVVVARQGSVAAVTTVEGDRRLEELSRMLSGLPESERGREHAAELLDLRGRPSP